MEEQSSQQVFALDIGTRSLIGIVGHKEGDQFWVEAYEELQHPKRAMIDGQIEDIAQVARVAAELKQRLEEKTGTQLSRVAVAGAGRALKSISGVHKRALFGKAVDKQLLYELESCAVNEARDALNLKDSIGQYHCVGHSVVQATIDGYTFSNLLQHKGDEAEVEVIATFLPGEVVSSLRRCMELVGLEIETLTLEPIAAMRAVLPQDIRLLNLAMVDIGAGTSDIAITKDGKVAGYTMATVAGDEITEAIIRHCLVNFETAEQIKLALENGDGVSYTDILGHTQNTTSESILQAIDQSVDVLAKVIADRIEECNGGVPAAVFLVGGGSRTFGLCQKLAERLGIDTNKVAVAGTNFSGRILNESAGLDAPEHATPVGIALTAAEEISAGGSFVQVNEKKIRLFIGGEGISVMDVLLLAGYRHADLMGHSGRSVVFQLNNERKVAFGKPHIVAQIQLNGEVSALTAPVYGGDVLTIEVAENGEDAHPVILDYMPKGTQFSVFLGEVEYSVGDVVLLNGRLVTTDTEITEQAQVVFASIKTVRELCEASGIDMQKHTVYCNGEIATKEQILEPGDLINEEKTVFSKAEQAENSLETSKSEMELNAPESQNLPSEEQNPTEQNALIGSSMRVQLNGKNIVLPPKADKSQHTVLDLLPLLDIDPSSPKGWVQIECNGKQAGYLDVLQIGDTVEINWEEKK